VLSQEQDLLYLVAYFVQQVSPHADPSLAAIQSFGDIGHTHVMNRE
jgi:hypothetical protein